MEFSGRGRRFDGFRELAGISLGGRFIRVERDWYKHEDIRKKLHSGRGLSYTCHLSGTFVIKIEKYKNTCTKNNYYTSFLLVPCQQLFSCIEVPFLVLLMQCGFNNEAKISSHPPGQRGLAHQISVKSAFQSVSMERRFGMHPRSNHPNR